MSYLDILRKLEAAERLLEGQVISYFVTRLSLQQANRSIGTYRRLLRKGKLDNGHRSALLGRMQTILELRATLEGQLATGHANHAVVRKLREDLITELDSHDT